jgi:hypothetical protein
MRFFEKKAFMAIIRQYCIQTTAHGFKYMFGTNSICYQRPKAGYET